MLFELARYNFTSYMVRNFDIEIEQVDGLNRMLVKGFRNYDEALQYARQLQKQKLLMKFVGKSRQIVISDVNLPMLGKQFSYADYAKFYEKNFAPLKIASEDLLEIPEVTVTEPDESETKKPQDDFDEEQNSNQNSTNTFFEEEPQPAEKQTTESGVVNIEDEQPTESTTETVIEEEPTTTVIKEEPATTVVEEEPATTVIEEPKPVVKEQPKPVVKEEPKQLEDEFYFGEDPQPQQSTSKKQGSKTQKDNFDDDEYYDLDGF